MEQATLRAPGRIRALLYDDRRAALGSLDWGLLVLAALLVLTEAFGKSFSTIGIDSISLYVTEVALVAALILALRHYGVRSAVSLVADRIPPVLLIVLWLAGLVAALRGLTGFDVSMTLDDIGLVEYSILLVIVALVADTTRRSELLTRALALGGIAALLVFGTSEVISRTWGDPETLPVSELAAGMYMSFYVVWVGARLLHRLPVAPVHLVLVALALILIGVTKVRSAWVGIGLALLVVAVLAPTVRRRAAGVGAAVVLAVMAAAVVWSADTGLPNINTDAPGSATISGEVGGLTGSGDAPEAENVQWRLAFWEDQIRGARDAPVFGAGFGEPSAFTWEGRMSDFRRGFEAYPGNISDVTGPHNGFIDFAYRMGVPALVALLGLIGVALWRLRFMLATSGDRDPDRARRVALVGMFASVLVVVVFTDALRGPYLGIFFWTILGLLLVEGRLAQEGRGAGTRDASVDA